MTKIEWVRNEDGTQGKSWNPITGCTKTSPGCKNCYAERMARRLAGRCGYPEAPHHFDVTLRRNRLEQPLRRKKPTTYFVCSMSDLFHEIIPKTWLWRIFKVMAAADRHTFQILTKRPRGMLGFCQSRWYQEMCHIYGLDNIWLGVSVENQAAADARREDFRAAPAAVKFVSYEPALGPVDWTGWEFIDQLIFGGESGPGARPAHPDWFRSARDWAGKHGITRFFKQYGEWIAHDIWHQADKPRYTRWGCMNIEGTYFDQTTTWNGMQYRPEDGREVPVYQVGKKAAGRQLDGRTWNQMPRTQ